MCFFYYLILDGESFLETMSFLIVSVARSGCMGFFVLNCFLGSFNLVMALMGLNPAHYYLKKIYIYIYTHTMEFQYSFSFAKLLLSYISLTFQSSQFILVFLVHIDSICSILSILVLFDPFNLTRFILNKLFGPFGTNLVHT